jgi:ubiquinone/menaquinone biosynthesis C-methylase UbiE
MENRVVTEHLRKVLSRSARSVLDLGCGTGLGRRLIATALGRAPDYHGIDISTSMLEICRARYPDAHLECGSMSDLTIYDERSFDLVSAFFASASYAPSGEALMASIDRVLKPGGTVYLSFLNRHALRRVVTRHCGRFEVYDTRHSNRPDAPPVRVYSRKELSRMASVGTWLVPQPPRGLGAFAGVAEFPFLWPISMTLDASVPQISHLLEVTASKAAL